MQGRGFDGWQVVEERIAFGRGLWISLGKQRCQGQAKNQKPVQKIFLLTAYRR
jgi:predicted RNA-binding protein YlxR (DUF448 family)